MKEILDTIVWIIFIIMIASFVINFNKQQIKKHTDKLEKNKQTTKNKDKSDE